MNYIRVIYPQDGPQAVENLAGLPKRALYLRILERVEANLADDVCWPWRGAVNPNGYGALSLALADGTRTTLRAHRAVYELWWGPIPDGMELDHLCRNRRCCNPRHLEVVTHTENVKRGVPARGLDHPHGRKTHCPQGHPYDEANTAVYDGHRVCIACRNERNRARVRSQAS